MMKPSQQSSLAGMTGGGNKAGHPAQCGFFYSRGEIGMRFAMKLAVSR
jgi:hypothetical protein